jgi:hypothetical protein
VGIYQVTPSFLAECGSEPFPYLASPASQFEIDCTKDLNALRGAVPAEKGAVRGPLKLGANSATGGNLKWIVLPGWPAPHVDMRQ